MPGAGMPVTTINQKPPIQGVLGYPESATSVCLSDTFLIFVLQSKGNNMSASLFDIYWDDNNCEREYKFYVYATDKKDYYLDEVCKTDDRKRLVETIQRWASPTCKKKWAKKHLGDDNLVELTITQGECNWTSDINLLLNANTHEVFIVEKPSQKRKPWNGKLVFHRK